MVDPGESDSIENPAALPSWLMTTARRQALRYVRTRQRVVPVESVPEVVSSEGLDEALLDSELKLAVIRGLRRLSDSCQSLLRLLTVNPPLSYAEIAELLDCSIGDIGPRRMRCLKRLRLTPEVFPFVDVLGG